MSRKKTLVTTCLCCNCYIQLEDKDDIRICEECIDCPPIIDGPCRQVEELK